jgi:hypothetical protein
MDYSACTVNRYIRKTSIIGIAVKVTISRFLIPVKIELRGMKRLVKLILKGAV